MMIGGRWRLSVRHVGRMRRRRSGNGLLSGPGNGVTGPGFGRREAVVVLRRGFPSD